MKCIVPWIHLNVRTDGSIQACPFAQQRVTDQGREVSIKTDSTRAILNASRMREIRLAMLQGDDTLPECDRCRQEEKLGAVSKRISSNRDFSHHAERWDRTNADGSIDDFPILLNIPMGNLCNAQCRMCNPKFSSRIAAGMYSTSGDSRWKSFMPKADVLKAGNLDTYLSNFDYFSEALPQILEMLPKLETIYLYGGEPTLHPQFNRLLEHILKEGLQSKLSLGMTTNLSSIKWLSYFQERWHNCLIHFSFDGVGKVYEYIRHPLTWERFESNLRSLLGNRNLDSHPCMTISALNVSNFPEMIAYLDEVYSAENLALNLRINLLVSPQHLRIERLPLAYRQQIHQKISAMDISRIKSISHSSKNVEFLEKMIVAILARLSSEEEANADFFTYNKSLDKNRGQILEELMPELQEYITEP